MTFFVVEHASHLSEIMTTNGSNSIKTVTSVLVFKHLKPDISKPQQSLVIIFLTLTHECHNISFEVLCFHNHVSFSNFYLLTAVKY